jgi:hypothetical protein
MILKARMEHAEVTATPGKGTWTASAAVGDLKLSFTEEIKKAFLPHARSTDMNCRRSSSLSTALPSTFSFCKHFQPSSGGTR